MCITIIIISKCSCLWNRLHFLPCLFYRRNVNFGLNVFYIKYKIRVVGHLLCEFGIS